MNHLLITICGIIADPLFFLMMLIYLLIPIGICYFIYKWVNQFLELKKEQNDLLREIIKKMGK